MKTLLVALVCLLSAQASLACKCVPPVGLEANFKKADVVLVFQGLWNHADVLKSQSIPAPGGGRIRILIEKSYAAVQVVDILKINSALTVAEIESVKEFVAERTVKFITGEIDSGYSCPGMSAQYFEPGKKYIFMFSKGSAESISPMLSENDSVGSCSTQNNFFHEQADLELAYKLSQSAK